MCVHVCVLVYLSVVNDVEDGRGHYAADGVGQHKDHHILPSPQRDLNITVQHTQNSHGTQTYFKEYHDAVKKHNVFPFCEIIKCA